VQQKHGIDQGSVSTTHGREPDVRFVWY